MSEIKDLNSRRVKNDKIKVKFHRRYGKLERIKRFFTQFRFEKPFVLLWWYTMKVNFMYMAQGFVGLISLGIFMPNWSHKPSCAKARQSGICMKIKENEEVAESNSEKPLPHDIATTAEEEKAARDAFVRRMQGKKEEA